MTQDSSLTTGKRPQGERWWEHFPHKADVGIRGIGPTLEAAFEQAALAMTAVQTDPERIHPLERVEIKCGAPDIELLLVDWLNALLFQTAANRILFSSFEVEINDLELRARARGEKIDPAKHDLGVEVKGATYTELKVAGNAESGWTAQCVVDV